MELLKNLITIDRKADLPVYLQISNAFIHNIRRGRLRKGLKLPGSREAANLLNINRMTMVAAYDELQAQGWVERISRKGTFVNHNLPEIKPKKISEEKEIAHFSENPIFPIDEDRIISFPVSSSSGPDKLIINDGFPDVRLAPIRPLGQHMRSIARRPVFRKYLTYGSSQGTRMLCKTLAYFLSDTRGLPVSTENIMITNGAQMGIYLIAKLLLEPGDQVVVGEPGYFGANRAFRQQGAVLNRVPVDDHGLDVDAVEQICKQKKIRLLYAVPHHHHPTTVTLIPERRVRLLELAAKYKFAIIEDDYDYDFHYASSPMLPMASLDHHGIVIYVGTLTKTIAPAIRIGFIAGPKNVVRLLSEQRRGIDWQGDSLMELAIAELYKDGTIARHIKQSVKLYHKRRDSFCRLLKNKLGNHVAFDIPDGGMSVWTKFKETDLRKISQKAVQQGLKISDGQEYNTHTTNYNACRMGFASLNQEEQEQAIDILMECVE